MKSQILLAENAGFCMGVSLALNKLDKALEQTNKNRVFTFGPIIHNPQVLDHYEKKGVRITQDLNEPAQGDTVVIRAHGIPLDMENRLAAKKVFIIDATCPKVKKAQLVIAGNSRTADCLLLYGEPDHPEVKGLLSYAASEAHLFEDIEHLENLPIRPGRRYCVAAQTTQDREQFKLICTILKTRLGRELTILDTICDATKNRQVETIAISRRVECMIVVGGRNSGNTRRLCQVAMENCASCFHIETGDELSKEMIAGFSRFGLTAGASTPDNTIRNVYQRLKAMINC